MSSDITPSDMSTDSSEQQASADKVEINLLTQDLASANTRIAYMEQRNVCLRPTTPSCMLIDYRKSCGQVLRVLGTVTHRMPSTETKR